MCRMTIKSFVLHIYEPNSHQLQFFRSCIGTSAIVGPVVAKSRIRSFQVFSRASQQRLLQRGRVCQISGRVDERANPSRIRGSSRKSFPFQASPVVPLVTGAF